MKRVFFEEPVFYIFLAVVILAFGTWMSSVINSFIPILLVGIPLGWLLVNVAGKEIKEGGKWFQCVIAMAIVLVVWALFKGLKVAAFSGIFIIIVVSHSLYQHRTSYKKINER